MKILNNRNTTVLLLILICLILLFVNFFTINKISQLNNKFNNYENTIKALNDSITVTVKDGYTQYSKLTPEIDLKDLLNSEFFNTLSKEQQEFYRELKQIKGLISATQIELKKQGQSIDNIVANQNPGIIDSNTISFELGTVLNFKERDTTKKLQWKSDVTLNDEISIVMFYEYDVNILTTYERQRDGTIVVNYKIDDPELIVQSMNNFIIPVQERKGMKKFWDKNKGWIRPVGLITTFVGGVVVGVILSK